MNYGWDDVLTAVDHALNTKTKKHIAGGVLFSVALLFGGLAITVMTLKQEDNKNDGRKR